MKTEQEIIKKDEPRKCGCGKTKNESGYCDGSHAK